MLSGKSRMEPIYKAAVVQMDSGADREKNLKKIADFAEEAAQRGARLVMLPETADYIGEDMAAQAWNLEDAVEYYGRLAKEQHIYLHCGSFTKKAVSGEKPENTTLFFNPEGRCLGSYSKVHMFDIDITDGPAYQESAQLQAGKQLVVARTPLGGFGLSICYDIRFGEMFRLMALQGAEIFCVCADFTMPTGKDHWEVLLRARAIENGCYVLAADQIGTKPAFTAYGNSMIIDPWGTVIARCSNREGIVTADIDLNYVNQIRRQVPSLKNRRQDIYQLHGAADILRDD